jgi:EAL domain-containing protein (putative c-di-GMP-specific phosphodiesterase class I)
VTALIELGHNLGMSVISEGVETVGQHVELTRLASDSCQGYYFALPMSGARIEALVHGHADGVGPRLPAPGAVIL